MSGTLDLEINPTRFLAYQDAPYVEQLGQLPSVEVLHREAERRLELQRATLDVQDNLLLGVAHLGGPFFGRRTADWRRSLGFYLAHVERICVDALAPYGSLTHVNDFHIQSVKQCECYWELHAEQAPLVLQQLAIVVKAGDPHAEVNRIVGAELNATWLKINLTKKIQLVAYAKCIDRLRFEVRYQEGIQGELGATHCNVTAPIIQRLMDIRAGAANRLQRFWNDYRGRVASTAAPQQMIDFIAKFNAATPIEVRRELLTLLAANRSLIADAEAGTITPELCDALRRAGVLERSRHRQRGRVYRVARKYRAIFQRMFGGDDLVT